MTNELKNKLGEYTEKVESKIKESWKDYQPYYGKLESWKRGLILIALALFLFFVIYQLTKPERRSSAKKEREMEERLLRQMAFFKRLKE